MSKFFIRNLLFTVAIFPAMEVVHAQNSTSVRSSNNMVVIKGTVVGDTKGHNRIYYFSDGSERDSATIVNGQFTINLPFNGITKQLFYTQYEIAEFRRYGAFPLLIDQPGTINLRFNIEKGFNGAEVSGPKTTVAYNKYISSRGKMMGAIGETMKKFQAVQQSGSPEEKETMKATLDSVVMSVTSDMIAKFLKQENDSYVGAYIILENKPVLKQNVKPLYDMLSPEIQHSEQGRDILAFYNSFRQKAVEDGQVKNFSLNDEKGNKFNFGQLKGKYVWIDFWASWCQPCKMAFPSMQKVYEKYKNRNFEILGISTDQDKEAWLKAVKAAKNPWIQIWDNASVASQFSVTSFPTSFLVGPDGKIILSEMGFNPKEKSQVEKKLDEIFGN